MSKSTVCAAFAFITMCLLAAGCDENISGPDAVLESTSKPALDASEEVDASNKLISVGDPDLVIDRVQSNGFGMNVTIRNASSRAAAVGPISVMTLLNGGYLGSTTWGSSRSPARLNPGESRTIWVPAQNVCQVQYGCLDAGWYQVTAIVDWSNLITESNETNNYVQGTMYLSIKQSSLLRWTN